jgi:16S rRNA C1402 N4-methylase RsmH
MLNEVIKISSPSKGGKFIDCTFGGGGIQKKF